MNRQDAGDAKARNLLGLSLLQTQSFMQTAAKWGPTPLSPPSSTVRPRRENGVRLQQHAEQQTDEQAEREVD
ncbi:MAG TPA: hypothetical protein VIV40_41060, partial [Kofleriaceae bacterium]